MKKRRRIELIRYRSRVTVIEGGDSVGKAAATLVPLVIDIVGNKRKGASPADEASVLATAVKAADEKLSQRPGGWLRKLLRPRRKSWR